MRKQNNLSQEYIAEQLKVSRQAVSKWETGQSNPDTENLIKLAEILHVSVEFLLNGETDSSSTQGKGLKQRRLGKKHIVIIIVTLLIFVFVGGVIKIHRLPVDWDAGGCAGGYGTFIFNKYSESLVQKYLDCSDKKDGILSIEAINGTQEAEWEGRRIYLHFDIQYSDTIEGIVVERVTFIGHRIWIDTYKWGGAIIVG